MQFAGASCLQFTDGIKNPTWLYMRSQISNDNCAFAQFVCKLSVCATRSRRITGVKWWYSETEGQWYFDASTVALNLSTSTAAVCMDESAVCNNADDHLDSILPPTSLCWHLLWCTATWEAQASWILYESDTFSNVWLWYVVVQFTKLWSAYGMFQSLSFIDDGQIANFSFAGETE